MTPKAAPADPIEPGEPIRAAGGVVWREMAGEEAVDPEGSPAEVEVLLVHRPRYDDWSLPKGKLERGERHRDAALREVAEETGVTCRLGEKLGSTDYSTVLGPKRVKWWAMVPEDPTAAAGTPDDPAEIGAVEWVPLAEAWSRVSWGTDREVLGRFAIKVLHR